MIPTVGIRECRVDLVGGCIFRYLSPFTYDGVGRCGVISFACSCDYLPTWMVYMSMVRSTLFSYSSFDDLLRKFRLLDVVRFLKDIYIAFYRGSGYRDTIECRDIGILF